MDNINNKDKFILGIGGYYHDSSACLIKNGEVVAAAEEERFNRIKHSHGLPYQAINYCLHLAKIELKDVESVGFYWNYWLWLKKRAAYRMTNFWRAPFCSIADIVNVAYQGYLPLIELQQKLNVPRKKIKIVNHHLAHAASAFFVSPFEKAAILSLDFLGEETTTFLGLGLGNKITKVNEIKYPHSIGALYTTITEFLGFQPTEDEYKVMGLASFGKPNYYKELVRLIRYKANGKYELDTSYFNYQITGSSQNHFFSDKFIRKFGPPRKHGEKITQYHMDIAASLQKLLEEIVFYLVQYLYEKSKTKNLCIVGGVGLNCAMNGKLLRESSFKNIYVQPAANDAGCALGCCYHIYNQLLDEPRKYIMESAYLGPEYSDLHIKNELDSNKITYEYYENIEEVVANLLAKNKIIGWFQGRMEWGPRALGNRSILASPISLGMQDLVNRSIKFREEFRPFAPSVIEEDANDYFDMHSPSPFMLFLFDVKEKVKASIPAVTHIDGTARVQTVNRKTNPRYYKLLSEFKKVTGVPVLLNTSFNVKGEPIVCNVRDAVRCFYSTGLDYLAVGNYLLRKKPNND